MKLAKLSLAAIVAAGAMTTFANATPLEEAIQGVELNGMLRLRWYNESDAIGGAKNTDPGTGESTSNRYRMSSSFGFTVPVAENVTAKVGLSADHNEYTKTESSNGQDLGYATYDMTYKTADYSVKVGRMALNTPWTDPGFGGSKGTGVLGMYTGVEGWAFAAAAFANTDKANAGLTEGDFTEVAADYKNDLFDESDLYAAAAIGSVGPVNMQFWTAKMTDVIEASYFAQADVKFEGFTLKAQANQLELADVAGEALDGLGVVGDDTGLFWAAEAGFGMEGFNVKAGYIANDDEQPIHTLSADDAGMIKAGKQIYYETTNVLDAETMFVAASYAFDKYRVGAGYVDAEINDGTVDAPTKYDMDETYVEVGYKYSKNFDLSAYYSMYEGDDADDENNQFQFQAIYKF